ncbi:hypothetical protein [Stieleria tagensis]|uniref:hypothetical protein n=1 Tax=Stieleria tagensis TaxID=2956795 RepID=UPI00209A891B|nr:hypothetical protein [Stieleria tagensis]
MRSLGLVGVCVIAIGCGSSDQPDPPDHSLSQSSSTTEPLKAPWPETSFGDQIIAGRQATSDRIELIETVADDSMLSDLSPDDEWLEVLILDAGRITDAGIESIAKLPKLWHLRLRSSPIGDDGLRQLTGSQTIQILNLPQSEATAAGVAELAKLPNLRNLRLGGNRLAADTAAGIASIDSLRNLHLIGVPIDDQGLRQIASLPKLQSLYLDDSAVTSAGWDWLFETHPDLHVHVNQKHLDRGHQ